MQKCRTDGWVDGRYLRPDWFLDHLTAKKNYDENVDNYPPAQYLSTNSHDALQFWATDLFSLHCSSVQILGEKQQNWRETPISAFHKKLGIGFDWPDPPPHSALE